MEPGVGALDESFLSNQELMDRVSQLHNRAYPSQGRVTTL